MIHARKDYNRIQEPIVEDPSNLHCLTLAIGLIIEAEQNTNEKLATDEQMQTLKQALDREQSKFDLLGKGSTPIAEDEPVVLFRAQDKHFRGVLSDYMIRVTSDPEFDPGILKSITDQLLLATKWQREHTPKMPDMPKDYNK